MPRGILACGEGPISFIISNWLPVRPCCGSVGGDGGVGGSNGDDEGKNVAVAVTVTVKATKNGPQKLRETHTTFLEPGN